MIPTIGIMIGMYIIVRYCELFDKASWWAKLMIAIFAIITMFMIGGLIMNSGGPA